MRGEESFPITGGVYLAPAVCYPIWQMLQRQADTMFKRDGARPTPEVREAMQALRSAAQAHMSANGHPERTSADLSVASIPERQVLTTEEFAGLLKVTERHALRVADQHQITSVARGLWNRQDVNYILAIRRGEARQR